MVEWTGITIGAGQGNHGDLRLGPDVSDDKETIEPVGREIVAILLGLAAATCWGGGDFSGGVAAKRGSAYGVVLISQLVGMVLLAGLAVGLAEPFPTREAWLYGGLAGICGAVGLVILYRSLARGPMGVVAPLAAVGTAGLPVLWGAWLEGWPAPVQVAGFVLAMVAVWLISTTGKGQPVRARLRDLALPAAAGLTFGLFLILIAQAGEKTVLWPLVAARLASLGTLLAGMIVTRRARKLLPAASALLPCCLAGILDASGNALYTLATQAGRLDVATVVSSLYPAGTVLLAWIVLKERLAARQWLGIGAALVALVLIGW